MEERTDIGDASTIWKFLDNMYVSNPAAYKNFIDNVLKEGKDQNMGPPMPHIAIQTIRVPPVIPSRKYFINIVKWTQVPKPENNHCSVPMVISEQRKELVDQEWAILIDIAVNPFLFKENAPLNMDVSELLHVALLYVESKFSFKLSKKYTILDKKYIGNVDNLLNLMCPSSLKDSLKNSYNSNSLNENVFLSSNNESNQNIAKSNGSISPQQVDHSFALHEISSKVTSQKCSIKKVPQTPRAEMNVDKENMNIFVTVQLPGVQGVAECVLELTQSNLLLSVSDKYELQLDLPLNIDVNSSKAKFVRDEQVLFITAPFQTT